MHYSILLGNSLTQQERQAAINAVNAWNAQFAANGATAAFTIVSYGPATLTVQENGSIGNDPGAIDPTYHYIYLNPMYDTRTDGMLTDIMGHELGHALGFNDQYDAFCYPYTIMHGSIDPSTSGPWLSGPTSYDDCSLQQEFASQQTPPPTGCGSSSDPSTTDSQYQTDCSPIVLAFNHVGYDFSAAENGVRFDINADGIKEQVAWPVLPSSVAFLFLDRNGNGLPDDGSELFGNVTPLKSGGLAPNGFAALAEFDDDGDGMITPADAVWPALRLWFDRNRDGSAQPSEISTLDDLHVIALDVRPIWTGRRDAFGNLLRWKSSFTVEGWKGNAEAQPYYDVYLVIKQP